MVSRIVNMPASHFHHHLFLLSPWRNHHRHSKTHTDYNLPPFQLRYCRFNGVFIVAFAAELNEKGATTHHHHHHHHHHQQQHHHRQQPTNQPTNKRLLEAQEEATQQSVILFLQFYCAGGAELNEKKNERHSIIINNNNNINNQPTNKGYWKQATKRPRRTQQSVIIATVLLCRRFHFAFYRKFDVYIFFPFPSHTSISKLRTNQRLSPPTTSTQQ